MDCFASIRILYLASLDFTDPGVEMFVPLFIEHLCVCVCVCVCMCMHVCVCAGCCYLSSKKISDSKLILGTIRWSQCVSRTVCRTSKDPKRDKKEMITKNCAKHPASSLQN